MEENQEIRYAPIYRAIAATGYDGFIGHEFITKGSPMKELEIAYLKCEAALKNV